jgi:hypothetical protein
MSFEEEFEILKTGHRRLSKIIKTDFEGRAPARGPFLCLEAERKGGEYQT